MEEFRRRVHFSSVLYDNLCTQRKERNKMTSLLDRPITAANDDGVCRWHAAKLWQTCHKVWNYWN